jgi:hypothetical protein
VANEKWLPGHFTASLSRYRLGVSRDVVRWGGSLPDGVRSSPLLKDRPWCLHETPRPFASLVEIPEVLSFRDPRAGNLVPKNR